MNKLVVGSVLLSIMLLSGCDTGGSNSNSNSNDDDKGGSASALDGQLRQLIQGHGLTGDPSTGRAIPTMNDPKAQLGMKLFFTKTMSLPGDTACASCHHPLLGGGDGVQIAVGTGAVDTNVFGYRRVLDPAKYAPYYEIGGGPSQAVNSPTSYNAALQDRFMAWNGVIEAAQPWAGNNGSVGGLYDPDSAYAADGTTRIVDPYAGANIPAAQSRFPVQNPLEMANHDPRVLNLSSFGRRKLLLDRFTGEGNSGELGSDYLTAEQRAAWQQAFANAGVAITDANIYNMISYYEQTQLFVNNPWKSYVQGNNSAISEQAKAGAILFYSSYEQGGANCAECHSGDFFMDNAVHVMAVPQIGNGSQPDGDSYGREEVTHLRSDRYKFHTMSLLNIAKTGPWGHDGAFTTLRGIVQHMVNPATPYDKSNVKQTNMQNLDKVDEFHAKALAQLEANRANGVSPHRVADLSGEQIDQIVAFLETLTDPSLNNYTFMQQWIPPQNAESTLLDLQVNVSLPPEATHP
jgi:cytochrome c peroxidase